MNSSKYWSEMFISTDSDPQSREIIISKEEPVKYTEDRPIIFSHITPEDYQEVSDFYKTHNKMSSGNTTLLTPSDIAKYLSLDNFSVIIRSIKEKLMGSVISINLPIRVDKEVIYHGCTTFLTVHSSIRKHGICMVLIRKLTELGFHREIFCSYYTIPFKLGDNSISVECYYRPILLTKCRELGFVYPDCYDIRMNTKNRLLYTVKKPPNFSFRKADIDSLEYYRKVIGNKRFVFYPDEKLWKQFIELFPTYLISRDDNVVGIVSINTVHCEMSNGIKGKIAMPIICNGNTQLIMEILPTIVCDHDVLYVYCCGDITKEILEKFHFIKTSNPVWFSLYNNRINLDIRDLSVPIL